MMRTVALSWGSVLLPVKPGADYTHAQNNGQLSMALKTQGRTGVDPNQDGRMTSGISWHLITLAQVRSAYIQEERMAAFDNYRRWEMQTQSLKKQSSEMAYLVVAGSLLDWRSSILDPSLMQSLPRRRNVLHPPLPHWSDAARYSVNCLTSPHEG